MRPPSAGRIALLGRRNANRVPDWACRALHRQLRTVRWPGGAGPVLSAAGSLHHLLTPWPAVCHGARAATRTNTRRASRSGAHIRACSSAGRVLAERCLGISRLVVCWFACASAARVGRASVYRLGYTWRRESGLALSPSGADGAPQRRTEIYVIRKTRNRAAQVPVDASFSITPPRGVKR
jgi:hypothetical protein